MTVWEDARDKRTRRRQEGGAKHHPSHLLLWLEQQCDSLVDTAHSNTRSTIVVGVWLSTPRRFFAVAVPKDARKGLAEKLGVSEEAVTWTGYSDDANLHSEMKIVKRVIGDGLATGKHGLAENLIICCVGKAVCADCCGWLTRYGVNHGPKCTIKGSDQGWRHPLTAANFRGEKEGDFTYTKSRKYDGSATISNPDPTQQRGYDSS